MIKNMPSYEWVDAPPAKRERNSLIPWQAICLLLSQNPGKWMRIPAHSTTHASGSAHHLNHGRIGGIQEGDIEATSSGLDIYARWVGDEHA